MRYKDTVVFITSYFPPEIGAASNRIHLMSSAFVERGYNVKVITPLPNYPQGKISYGYRGKLFSREKSENIEIWRLPIYPSNSKNGLIRIFSMTTYAISVAFFIPLILHKTSFFVVQCPPLPVSFISTLIIRLSKGNIILNVSDLWPLSAKDMGAIKDGYIYRLLDKLARKTYRYSDLVLGQSQEILDFITELEDNKPTFLYRNLQNNDYPIADGIFTNKIIYAGLIGHAQKLSQIIFQCRIHTRFDIFGHGGDTDNVKSAIVEVGNDNISYHGSLTIDELGQTYPSYSYSLIPLANPIYGAVPSKLFDSVSRGVPVIFMGGGEGAQLTKKYNLGYVVAPQDYIGLEKVLAKLNEDEHSVHYANCCDFTDKHLSFNDQLNDLIQLSKKYLK